MRAAAKEETTRNGRALTLPNPYLLTITNPTHRVISCPIRDANPFFHVMEVVWMFAGQRNVNWLRQFNSRIDTYADDGVMHGAYGYRWFIQWGNQIQHVIQTLRRDPTSRQCVITMWDPLTDNMPWKDIPCNTHIYFRAHDNELDMTVCNRSNDLVWGMFGANVVHMTYLHEYIAIASGLELGNYQVFTNNLHFYTNLYPNGKQILENIVEGPVYDPNFVGFPILNNKLEAQVFCRECDFFTQGRFSELGCPWLKHVAMPMYKAYMETDHVDRLGYTQYIMAEDWKKNCFQWLERRNAIKLQRA